MLTKNKLFLLFLLLVCNFNFIFAYNFYPLLREKGKLIIKKRENEIKNFSLNIKESSIIKQVNNNIFDTNKIIKNLQINNNFSNSDFEGINQLSILLEAIIQLDKQEKLYNNFLKISPAIIKTTSFYLKKINKNIEIYKQLNFTNIINYKNIINSINTYNKQLVFLYNFLIKNRKEEKK